MTEVAVEPVVSESKSGPEINWSNADWSKTNQAVADALGTTYYIVSCKRRELGIASGRRGRPAISTAGYESTDWTQTDKVLSASLGITVNQVNYLRKKLGKTKRKAVAA